MDLNRRYHELRCSNKATPTIYALKKLITQNQADDRGGNLVKGIATKHVIVAGVEYLIDLHGHSVKNNVFLYGNSHKDLEYEPRYRPLVFADSFASQCKMFCIESCRLATQKSKRSTGRYVVWEVKILRQSLCPLSVPNGFRPIWFYNELKFWCTGARC